MIALLSNSSVARAEGHSARPGAADYLNDAFTIHRVLDWGERPVWSPDGAKLAFTKSDTEETSAFELDLRTGTVRCLTCRWGANGLVSRIYYLPDGSFLIEAGSGLETATAKRAGDSGQRAATTELYWMPASASMPPQALQAKAIGEIAILEKPLSDGGFEIAWGTYTGSASQLVVADLVDNGQRAALTNRRIVYSYPPAAERSLATFPEAYDFADDGSGVTFWSLDSSTPTSGMYEVRLATGAVSKLPSDGAHSETHLFPDGHYGLEESNRISDPNGPLRGISGLGVGNLANVLTRSGNAQARELAVQNGGRPFDLFVRSYDGPSRIRRLTNVSDLGGEAHQSSPAPDGRRIAFALRAPKSGALAGKSGLYVGEFAPGRRPAGSVDEGAYPPSK